jgi:hypothetical protein
MSTFIDDFGTKLYNIHAEPCQMPHCVIHKPSDHHMRSWPLRWRDDRRIFERQCPHGVGHPDPDDVQFKIEYHEDTYAGIHGCDGCCART